MSTPPDDHDVSVTEDLDPEPPSRDLRVRELMLGVLLLLAVLAWGGWQSWQQWSMEKSYRAGLQAEEQRDWDRARQYYAAASGFRDAASRSAEAARLIETRDRRYSEAVAAAGDERWPEALRAAQAVRDVQPGYRDTDQMGSEAERQVYRLALSGTIALRTEAAPPGLYYRTGDDWVWLEGSDPW